MAAAEALHAEHELTLVVTQAGDLRERKHFKPSGAARTNVGRRVRPMPRIGVPLGGNGCGAFVIVKLCVHREAIVRTTLCS